MVSSAPRTIIIPVETPLNQAARLIFFALIAARSLAGGTAVAQ